MTVQATAPGLEPRLLFSALPNTVALEAEPLLAEAGYILSSNAKILRMEADVPLILPDVNADHLPLVREQQKRGWKGFVITNANCVAIPLSLSLKPLQDAFGIEKASARDLMGWLHS